LAVNDNSEVAGAPLITWACNGTASQVWTQGELTVNGNLGGFPAYTLQSFVTENCRGCLTLVAGVYGNEMTDGTQVITWTQDFNSVSTDNQGWAMEPYTEKNGNQCYQILNAGTKTGTPFSLGVQDASTAQGTPIVIWQDTNNIEFHMDQIWCVVY
jgi:hypothetical protein